MRTDTGGVARAGVALALANLRYWTTVAPLVREQLARWERSARAIPDPTLRELAVSKLREERFNVEMAATLATLAQPTHRRRATEAIVALQVAYDYLDLLTEQPPSSPLAEQQTDGRCLLRALTDALAPEVPHEGDYYRHRQGARDGGYLPELVRATRVALACLPAAEAIGEVALRAADRCAHAQALSHAAARTGTAEPRRWAEHEGTGTGLQWPEFLAGAAASVLAVHALIAAAGNPRTTPGDAERIDAVYLSICALTMLDSLVDHEHDIATGELRYAELYESRELMARSLASLVHHARDGARALPDGAHHIVTLTGVVAYYASAPGAGSAFALPVMRSVREELRPLIVPTLAIMRAWRLAKSLRSAIAPGVSSGFTRRS